MMRRPCLSHVLTKHLRKGQLNRHTRYRPTIVPHVAASRLSRRCLDLGAWLGVKKHAPRDMPQESAPPIGKRLRSTIQWVGTTSRAPTGGRVPSWGNLITLLDYEPVCHAAFASLGGLKNRRGFSRKHLRKGQLCRLYARKTRHCHSFAKPPKFYSIFLLISGRANSPHLGPLFPFQGEPIHHNY